MTALVLRSRRVVCPDGVRAATVHVRGGRIERISAFEDTPEGVPLVEAGPAALLPGLVDTHVHVNEPGRTDWEGFETATRAAAAGGITTIVDMPLNSIPPAITPRGVAEKAALTEGRVHVDVGLWGGAVPANTTGRSTGLRELLDEGVRGFKCFLVPSGVDEFPFTTRADVEAALSQLRDAGVPLMVHAELAEPIDAATAALEAEGADSRRYATYLASRPPTAEDRAVELLFGLAKSTGVPIHVVHLSSAGALGWLQRARDEAVPLTAETAPHYLHFTAEAVPDGATWFKCAPPIREKANRERLWEAVRGGLIEMVVSDHSPCVPELKRTAEGDFLRAWGGIAGLQFSLCAVWTEAKARGFGLADVVRWMCAAPARHAALADRKGGIFVGADADLVVFDPEGTTRVAPSMIEHRHKLTPYDGETLAGAVLATYLRGERVAEAGAPTPGARGLWLRGGRQ